MDSTRARTLYHRHRTEIESEGVGRSPICYIAGPMTGIENFNFPAFEQATSILREAGWFVYAPHENDLERGEQPRLDGVPQHKLKHYMKVDLAQVCVSDAVFMLDGWPDSKGAAIEFNTAEALDIPCYHFPNGGRIEIVGLDGGGQVVVVDETIFQPEVALKTHLPDIDWTEDPMYFEQEYPLTMEEAEQAFSPDSKATNPKDLVGSHKVPLHLWPTTATVYGSLGLLDGMLKYGRTNWREAGVRYSIYHDATMRHLNAVWEGEWHCPDSGLPHLAHALACIAIIVDAHEAGKLVDDRAYNGGGYRDLVMRMTPDVDRLKEKYADRDPKHWTIQDGRSI